VNVIAGSGGGGTSSSFGSAFPATGTAAGAEYLSTPPTLTNGQMVALQTNVSGALKVDGSAVTQPVSGTFWQATQPVSGTVTANQGGTWTVQPGNTANTTAWLVTGTGGTFPVTGTFWQATQPVSGTVTANQGGAPWSVNGDTASGASDANNPVKIGGLAKTTNPTAVTDGQRVNGVFDKQGKQIVVGAIRQLKGVQNTAITANTETTIVTAGGAGVLNDLYGLTLTNTSSTAAYITIKDSTAGTTRFVIEVPATDTRGFMLPVDSAVPQATAANNWTATVSVATTTMYVTALYVSNL
jgi:hypothetical protein